VVALSGGADSAALAALVKERGPVRATHIHHGLPASDEMEEAAGAVAARLEIPLEVERTTIEPFTEAAARAERYRILVELTGSEEWLLTAHTRDDQAETVLAHLLRGAGSSGLAGIPARRGRIVRPFLQVSRSQTREFASLAGLPWKDDPENENPSHLRNRIRNSLLPTLEAEWNPEIRGALVAAAEAFSSLDVEKPTGERWEDGWRMANSVLWAAGRERGAALLRESLRPLRDEYGLDRAEVARVWEVVTDTSSATELRGGWRVYRDGPWLVCGRRVASNGSDSPR
jgi:tRNA(Ile)-lysidine synthase